MAAPGKTVAAYVPGASSLSADFILEHCYFPSELETDELFTPRIEFNIGAVVHSYVAPSEWLGGLCWQHRGHEYYLDRVELRCGYRGQDPRFGPAVSPAAPPWTAPIANQTFVWSPDLTIEDLIGPVEASGVYDIGFSVFFTGRYHYWADTVGICIPGTGENYDRWTDWSWAFDPLEYSVAIEVPAPPPPELYPFPVFVTDLCYFPTYVTADEVFSPVFVVNNAGAAGIFYLAYWYLGAWHELYRGAIAEGRTYTHRMGAIRITDLIGPVTESGLADIRFYAGYIEPGVDPMTTYTHMFPASVYVEVVAPPEVYTCPYCGATFATQAELDEHIRLFHPELVKGLPWWPFVVGGLLIGGGIAALWPRGGTK